MMVRKIKLDTNLRCDLVHPGHSQLIPLRPDANGKKHAYAMQVVEGEAQGIYHGKQCYEAALEQMKTKQNDGQ